MLLLSKRSLSPEAPYSRVTRRTIGLSIQASGLLAHRRTGSPQAQEHTFGRMC
jgi:hypothetical protein